MNTLKYNELCRALKSFSYEISDTPWGDANSEDDFSLNVKVSVDSKKREDDPDEEGEVYQVNLIVEVEPQITKVPLFTLNVVYGALIQVLADNSSTEDLSHLLKVKVPEALYDEVRGLIWNATSHTGFSPLMLKDCDFENLSNNVGSYEEQFDKALSALKAREPYNIYPLGFQWLVEDMNLNEDSKNISNAMMEDPGMNLDSFETMPFYKYYVRFFDPIEYNHPDFDNCEDSLWPMLFQMAFALSDEVEISAGDAKYPELEFPLWGKTMKVSEMSLDEVKVAVCYFFSLLKTIAIMYRTSLTVNDEFAETLDDFHFVTKEELLKIHNFEDGNGNDKDPMFRIMDNFYDCLQNYEEQVVFAPLPKE